MSSATIRGSVCVAGVGETDYYKRGQAPDAEGKLALKAILAACEDAGIDVYVPKPATSNARARGRFDRRDFVYDRKRDVYVCPAGEDLT